MIPRLCTCCHTPHLTTDWYEIEPWHPLAGQIECGQAHEDRIRREVRDLLTDPEPSDLPYYDLTNPTPIRH
jgi:hypothetical protein